MNGDNKHTYIITEPNADPFNTVIEKGNITATFTPREMVQDEHMAEKYIKEFGARLKLEQAKMENYAHHHPVVAELSAEDLLAAHLYYESKVLCETIPPKIEEFTKQLQESREERKHIAETLRLEVMGVPTDMVVDQAMRNIEKGGASAAVAKDEVAPAPSTEIPKAAQDLTPPAPEKKGDETA